ncbi:MAG: endonuclease/exonuclease/phosphatase family protein [Prolixibacteraceae bacterium]|nr:endonuclease/exonuclease/phosphatase family protein [Prolixibacteraceae bacterium]
MRAISLFIIGAILAITSFSSVSGKSKPKSSFNIMTYNIRMNTPDDGVNAWPLRKDKVAGLIKFHQADLFGVQEALLVQMNDLKASLPEFDSYGVGRDDGKEAGEFMTIFFRKSRFEKLDAGTFWLSPTPDKPGLGWDAACNRTCTWIKFKDKATKKYFYHFNTHFDHRGKIAREESAKLILKFMDEINKDHLPMLLTGDFNSTKEATPIQTILKVLFDTRDKCQTPPYGPLHTSGGFAVKEPQNTIDYIFINQKVNVLRHGVLTDSSGLYFPSDHLPVLAEVEIL